MKRVLSLVMVFAICCTLLIPVSAESENGKNASTTVMNDISNELGYYEQAKSVVGMEDVDFSKLYIGEKINVYEYLPTGFRQIADAYLLFEDGRIVSLAYEVGESRYQFMSTLSQMIADTNLTSFAIVYDRTGCYLYNGEAFICIYQNYNSPIESRRTVSEVSAEQKKALSVSSTDHIQSLQYTTRRINVKAQGNIILNVRCVPQEDYNNLCWAATLAMITNYVNGSAYKVEEVAQSYYNPLIDKEVSQRVVVGLMNGTYNLPLYEGYEDVPSDAAIMHNMLIERPIYDSFTRSKDRKTHAGCVYGINSIAGRAMVMDPLFGSSTCYINSQGQYYYVDSYQGVTLTWTSAICQYWG